MSYNNDERKKPLLKKSYFTYVIDKEGKRTGDRDSKPIVQSKVQMEKHE